MRRRAQRIRRAIEIGVRHADGSRPDGIGAGEEFDDRRAARPDFGIGGDTKASVIDLRAVCANVIKTLRTMPSTDSALRKTV